MLLLLATLVAREVLGLGAGGSSEAPGSAEVTVEAGKEAYEMQTSAGVGAKTLVEAEERPPVTRDQVIAVTLLTAIMLFLYDGLQVGDGEGFL